MPAEPRHPEPEVLRAVRPALSRGRDVALIAAAGSGHELVFAEALAPRQAAEGVQALVLVPTRDASLRCAAAMTAGPSGARLRLLVWPPLGEAPELDRANALIGRPIPLLREIRGSRLGTSDVGLICVDAADLLHRAGEWPAVEALLDTVGAEAQKVVASGCLVADLADLLQRRLSRARRWPEELFEEVQPTDRRELEAPERPGDSAPEGTGAGELWYGAAAREEDRLDLLALAVAEAGRAEVPTSRSLVVCPDDEVATRIRSGLMYRGLPSGDDESTGIRVAAEPGATEATETGDGFAVVARWGPPDELGAYTEQLPEGGRRVAIVDSLHLTQLGLLAKRAGWKLRPLPERRLDDVGAAEDFRQAVRERLRSGDVAGELLLLRPLLEEESAVEVAGAVAALLRERRARLDDESRTVEGAAESQARSGGSEAVLPAWIRIFVNVGKRDGAGPGDIVGAIAGETGAAGGQIGKVDIRSTFTLVDIDAEIADRVVERLGGTQIKGRTVIARRAREAGPTGR